MARLLGGDLARLDGGRVHGEKVVTVDAQGGQAVGEAARRHAVGAVLVVRVRADRVAVVAAEEEHGRAWLGLGLGLGIG